jgi:hypothetical protein
MARQTWSSQIKTEAVLFWRNAGRERVTFPRQLFERAGELLAPDQRRDLGS